MMKYKQQPYQNHKISATNAVSALELLRMILHKVIKQNGPCVHVENGFMKTVSVKLF